MSYIRSGSKRFWFEGHSDCYVFSSCGYGGEPAFIEDYNDNYADNKDLLEVIGRILLRETKDRAWVDKIITLLSDRLKIPKKERACLTTEEQFRKTIEKSFKKKGVK